MADADNTTELGVDLGSALQDIEAFARKFDDVTAALNNATAAGTKYNKAGDLVEFSLRQQIEGGEKLASTFKAIFDSQEDANGVIQKTISGYQLVSQRISELTDGVAEAAAKQIQIEEEKTARIAKLRENLSQQLFAAREKEAKSNLNKAGEQLTRNTREFGGSAAAAVTNDTFKDQLSTANPNQLQAYNAALEKSIHLVTSGKVSVNEFIRVLDNVRAGRITTEVNPALSSLQKHLRDVNASLQTTGRDVSVAQAGVQDIFGRALQSASPNQILAFNKALAQSLTLLGSGKVGIEDFVRTLNQIRAGNIRSDLSPALSELQAKLVELQASFNVVGPSGVNAGKNISLSFQNVVRIFESQLLYSFFNNIQNSFSQATRSAADYSKQIGLIQTISQDANVSTGQWSDGLRALSDRLGTDITDTAASSYEALSNQVAKGADSFKFLTTAGEFARTTNSSLTDSVNLISSALNSYNLASTESERIAKSFFTTIDLGRVKASDLANSIGRITTQGANLGVELEEVNATISVLTRQGIKANEAFTLVGNVFQKLNKPTPELQKFLEKLGFATSEDAIAGLGGLTNFLLKLKDGSDEARVAYSQLFDEIRGRRGFENLTADGGKALLADLKAQRTSTNEYEGAKNIVANTFGQKFDVEINKIKNFFNVDVGGTFLRNVVSLSDSIGGLADKFIAIIGLAKQLVTVIALGYGISQLIKTYQALGQLVIIYGELKSAYLAAAGAANLLAGVQLAAGAATSFATAGISAIVALGAAYLLFNNDIYDKSVVSIREITAKYQEEADKVIAIEQKAADARSKAFESGLDKSRRALINYGASIRSALTSASKTLEESTVNITDRLKSQLDLISGTVRSQLQELESHVKRIEGAHTSNSSKIKGANDEFIDSIHERNLAINEQNVSNGGRDQGLQIQLDQINRLKASAGKAVFDTQNPERLQSILQKIDGLTKDFVNRAIKSNNVGAADQLLVHNYELGVDLLKRQNAELEKRKKLLSEQVNDQKALFEQFQEAQKHVLTFSPLDKDGNVKDKYRGEAGEQKAIQDLGKAQLKVNELLDKIQASTDTKIHTATESAKQIAELQKIFSQQGENVSGRITNTDALAKQSKYQESIAEETRNIVSAQQEQKQQQLDIIKNQQEQLRDARALSAAVAKNVAAGDFNSSTGHTFFDLTDSIENKINAFSEKFGAKPTLENLAPKRISEFAGNASKLLENSDIPNNKEQLNQAIKELQNAKRVASIFDRERSKEGEQSFSTSSVAKGTGLDKDTTIGGALDQSIRNLEKLRDSKNIGDAIAEGIKVSDQALETLKQKAIDVSPEFKAMIESSIIAGQGVSAGLEPILTTTDKVRQGIAIISRDLQALGKLKSEGSPSGTVPETKSGGGMVGYFAAGGFVQDFLNGKYAKGTDTIPAMLTKGESVLTVDETKRFYPLLQSLKSGRITPNGSQSTTNVGDIHINVQGGANSTQTIKEIGSGLRRGIRQGTLRLQ